MSIHAHLLEWLGDAATVAAAHRFNHIFFTNLVGSDFRVDYGLEYKVQVRTMPSNRASDFLDYLIF